MIKVDDLGCLNEGKARGLEGLEDYSSGRARTAQSSQDETARQQLLDARSTSRA